jgi:ubiquinone/menaquinone biosynthesis C-methylase UbiE
MAADYDKLAKIYDMLSRIIFGRNIVEAQVSMLSYIDAGDKILIVGGGTGWILEHIAEKYPQGLEIDYVESSAQMIAIAGRRKYEENQVKFINLPIESYVIARQYDVIITPFIFDNFKKEKLELVFKKIDQSLNDKGKWLYADFVYDKTISSLWQKVLLEIMYLFFRITTGIETQELIPMDAYFKPSYSIEAENYYYSKFIKSVVYRKI